MTSDSNRAQLFIDEVKQLTAKPCFTLKPVFDREPGITDSKLGGLPYWSADMPYPEYDGTKMSLLAQINLADIESDLLPAIGILQFFIATGTPLIYGVNFKGPDQQETFRIVYHPDIKEAIKIDAPCLEECENSPLHRSVALDLEPALSFMNMNDLAFPMIYHQVVERLFGEKNPGEIFQFFENDDMCHIEQELMFTPEPRHQVLGWPKFSQGDTRNEEQYHRFDTVLLQLDSQFTDDGELLMWGDMGVANFLISEENLRKLDFSSVLYAFTAS